MESWNYISRAEDFVHNESVPETDGRTARNQNGLMGWEFKASSAFGTPSFMSSNQESHKNPQLLVEFGSAERIASNTDKGSVTNVFSTKFGCGEESKYRDSPPLIDLKLGRFLEHKDVQGYVNPSFSLAESSMPGKKQRAGKLTTQIPYCQVYGCKKDLSNCKEYHKRHKVCEIHSKTAKVIVNGIDQRFCQQCSRFHLLSEFDDGKRSCRKRLAGHNERRRKPHVGMLPGRSERFFQPYNGQRLPAAASNSGCALSLLSCQSQNAPNIPSSIPTGWGMTQMSPQTSTSGVSNMFPTSGITSADETHMDQILISDGIGSEKYGINEFLPSTSSAEYRNIKNQISSGHGSTTINLLQLSSQLQQVEHQRQYMQVKQEDDTLFGLRIT